MLDIYGLPLAPRSRFIAGPVHEAMLHHITDLLVFLNLHIKQRPTSQGSYLKKKDDTGNRKQLLYITCSFWQEYSEEKKREILAGATVCVPRLSLSLSRFVRFFCCLLDSCPKKVKCWLTLKKKSELGACVVNDLTALLFKNWNEVRPYESSDSQVLWTWPAILVLRPAGKWVPEFICTLFPWQIILLFSHSWFAFILLANDRLRQSDLLSLCYTANAPQLGLFPQWQSIFALHADRKIDWEFNAQELAAERFIKRDFLICDTKKLHYDAKILPWDTWKPNLHA